MEEEEIEHMLVECQDCGAIVDGIVIASYYDREDDVTGRYTFLKCPRCGRPFIMLWTDNDPSEVATRIYPLLDLGISPAIPKDIRSAYEEARACFRAKAYTATAIMCRKALEGIADEHQIKGRNLDSSLKEMKEKGIIENRLYEWADALRISGNEAAHGVATNISSKDAKDILEFTNALLEYVFTFREKFDQFKKRRSEESSKTNKTANDIRSD